jgi:hypothetical protein
MPSSLPRWPAGSDCSWDGLFQPFLCSPAASAFPMLKQGRRTHWTFRGLLNVHSRYGLPARCIAEATHVSRRLRRLRYLHRRSDSYRPEQPSCRVGIAPTEEADSDCTCSPTLLKADRAAYRECFRLAGAGRLVPAISATATRSTAMQHAMRRRDPPQPPQPVCDSIRHGMSHLFGQRCLAPIRPD